MNYQYSSISNTGKRAKNEDDYYPHEPASTNNFFVVCDGMGGHGDGDLASAFVAEKLAKRVEQISNLEHQYFEEAIENVHLDLARYASLIGNQKMGTTVAFLKFDGINALAGWVGDSRIYQFRNGKILFKSTDHTLLELLIQNGQMPAEEAENFPMKHIIWQAIGPNGKVLKPSFEYIPNIEEGDVFLLATDGVTTACTDKFLEEIANYSANEFIQVLNQECLNTATDNFTFTLIKADASSIQNDRFAVDIKSQK